MTYLLTDCPHGTAPIMCIHCAQQRIRDLEALRDAQAKQLGVLSAERMAANGRVVYLEERVRDLEAANEDLKQRANQHIAIQRAEQAESQVAALAEFIMAEVPGEPSQSEGAVDCAIRIMRNLLHVRGTYEEYKKLSAEEARVYESRVAALVAALRESRLPKHGECRDVLTDCEACKARDALLRDLSSAAAEHDKRVRREALEEAAIFAESEVCGGICTHTRCASRWAVAKDIRALAADSEGK